MCCAVCVSLHFKIRGDRLSPEEWASLPLGWSSTQSLSRELGGGRGADDGEREGVQEQNEEKKRRRGAIETDRKGEKDRQESRLGACQVALREVRFPPKQQNSHLKQCFNEAACGG